MNEDLKGFVEIVGAGLLLGLLILVIVFGGIFAPLFGLGAAIFYAVWWNKNSPKKKEERSQARTKEMYKEAMKNAPQGRDVFEKSLHFSNGNLVDVALSIYDLEGFSIPPKPPPFTDTISGARYRDQLLKYIEQTHDPLKEESFVSSLVAILDRFDAPETTGQFSATQPIEPEQVQFLILSFFEEDEMFKDLKETLNTNFKEQDHKYPTDYKGDDCARAYLKNTPLQALDKKHIQIKLLNRFEHTHILGGTGSGKTTLIEYMISKDLEEDCCIIVIDNQRQIIPKLAKLDVDMAYVSPRNSLSLNLFDMPNKHTAIPLLKYVLAGLMEAPLTPKQELIFEFGTLLMLEIPEANILTFMDLLEGKVSFENDIERLEPVTRKFFETEFFDPTYKQTKKEISWRIWTMLKNPVLAKMFSAPTNKFNMKEEMNRQLILIDTDGDLLQDYSGMFGRLFIAQILQVAQERFQGSHKPVYIYLDEAYMYFDGQLSHMLETARKARIGVILAHQFLGRIKDDQMAAAIHSLTSTKFAAGISASDTTKMAKEMHTDPSFIASQPAHSFALYMKNNGVYSIKGEADAIRGTNEIPNAEMIERYGYVPKVEPVIPDVEEFTGTSDASPPPETGSKPPNSDITPSDEW